MKRHAPIVLLALAGLALAIHGPIHQPAHYHDFADGRALAGLRNAADVLSNAGFALVAIWGLWACRGAAARQALGPSWPGYMLFLVALLATAWGSSYYHLAPDDARLFWDRLPIALACAGLLGGAYADTHAIRHPLRLTVELAAFALLSVVWWRATADLRPYLLLQAAPLLAIPLWQASWHSPASERIAFAAAIGLYVLAKVAELADHAIFEALGVMSGHTLKHLLAVAASAVLAANLAWRVKRSGDEAVAVSTSLLDLQRLGGRGGP